MYIYLIVLLNIIFTKYNIFNKRVVNPRYLSIPTNNKY